MAISYTGSTSAWSSCTTNAETGAMLKIISLNGSVIASYPVQKDAVQTSVDVSRLAKGSYIVVFGNTQKQQTIKIIKQ